MRAFEHPLERIGYQALLIGVDRYVPRLIGIEGLNRAEIGRIFQHDVIAGIEKNFAH